MGASALVLALFVIATGVVFIVWQWRTAKNAEVLGRSGARFGPGWSIGGWFVPLANLVIPVLVMQDLWRGSDPESSPGSWRSRPRSALVGWWWAVFLVGGLVGRATRTSDGTSLSQLRTADERASVGVALFAVAAILALAVVRSLTTRQVTLRAPSAQGGSPAGWHPDPGGRFEYRYWDGHTWTEHVSTAGQPRTDPPPPASSRPDRV